MVAVRKDSLGGFPFRLRHLEFGMRDEQMPHDALKRLAVRRDMRGIYRRNDDAGRRLLRGVTAIATNDADDRRANLLRHLNRADEIGADILFQVASADGKNKQAVFRIDAAAF